MAFGSAVIKQLPGKISHQDDFVGKLLIDTHTHLCDPVFEPDFEAVLARARAAGISAVVLVGETLVDARKNIELAGRYPLLRPAAGLYPQFLDSSQADEMTAFIRAHRRQLAAIGEVGLDHWIVKSEAEKAQQGEIFRAFIELAMELDLPLNVHSRSAGKKAIEQLLACGATRVQLHAFDGRVGSAMPAVEAGYFFSVPPSIVRSRQKQKLVRALPLSCLLLETDSPALGPVPGERNEPANIILSIDTIAQIKGLRREAVVEACAVNTHLLYGASVTRIQATAG
jgi:TatD DNase family protein